MMPLDNLQSKGNGRWIGFCTLPKLNNLLVLHVAKYTCDRIFFYSVWNNQSIGEYFYFWARGRYKDV